MYQVRIVEHEGEMIVPLPQELIEKWGLVPGMELESEIQERCLTLLPPGVKPDTADKPD